MSVKNFIQSCYDSGLDLSGLELENFISCIKYLNRIFQDKTIKPKTLNYNSELSRLVGLNDKFDSKKVSDLYKLSFDNVVIQIIIYKNHYYCAVSGGFNPDKKVLNIMLSNYNLNFEQFFDFPQVEELLSVHGHCMYFGGNDFTVDNIGFCRIVKLFLALCQMYQSKIDKDFLEVK